MTSEPLTVDELERLIDSKARTLARDVVYGDPSFEQAVEWAARDYRELLKSHSRQLGLEAARLKSGLQKIATSDAECGCTHDTADCCNSVGVFCGRCIAAEVLNG